MDVNTSGQCLVSQQRIGSSGPCAVQTEFSVCACIGVCEIHTDKLAGGNTQIQDSLDSQHWGRLLMTSPQHSSSLYCLGQSHAIQWKTFITADILLHVKLGHTSGSVCMHACV